MEAERVLGVCRGMWGQSYVAAIFSLILHKWLLTNEEAGGKLQRHTCLNVLLTGCRQLFWKDIHWCTFHFESLFHFIDNIYATPTELPFKSAFLSLIGQFLPYYVPTEVSISHILSL